MPFVVTHVLLILNKNFGSKWFAFIEKYFPSLQLEHINLDTLDRSSLAPESHDVLLTLYLHKNKYM